MPASYNKPKGQFKMILLSGGSKMPSSHWNVEFNGSWVLRHKASMPTPKHDISECIAFYFQMETCIQVLISKHFHQHIVLKIKSIGIVLKWATTLLPWLFLMSINASNSKCDQLVSPPHPPVLLVARLACPSSLASSALLAMIWCCIY